MAQIAGDIFDILDVSLREDTYSSLIVHVFKRFPSVLKGVFNHLTNQKCTGAISVEFRAHHSNDGKDRPDIVVKAETAGGTWWLVIEVKIQSGEGHEQTRRYAKICEDAQKSRECRGSTLCFLTLAGDVAEIDFESRKPALWRGFTHLKLASLIEEFDVEHQIRADPVIGVPWCAYMSRLEHYAKHEAPTDDQPILSWLSRLPEYFVTSDERAFELGKKLFPDDLLSYAGIYAGKGQSQFIAQAYEVDWNTGYYRDGLRLEDCISVHYEISFPLNYSGEEVTCHLHFEPRPYMSELSIKRIGADYGKFREVREFIRKQLHNRLKDTGWTLSNQKLQMAKLCCPLTKSTTVEELKAYLKPHIISSRLQISQALKVTAQNLKLHW